MNKNIMLTKSDIDSLNLSTKQCCDRLAFKEECVKILSIKIHTLTKVNTDSKTEYYNKFYKLSDFCDESFNLEDDIDILFLEDGNAQYSYINIIHEGVSEKRYVCHIYDDTYVSNTHDTIEDESDSNKNKDIVSSFLRLYNYEHKYNIEDAVKNKIINNVMNEITNDLQYRFIIEKHFSNTINILSRLNEEDIIKTVNSLASLEYTSIYSVVYKRLISNVKLISEIRLKDEMSKYDLQMKSLKTHESEIYEKIYNFAQELFEIRLYQYMSEGVFLLNELYEISYDILLNMNRYNEIMESIQIDVLNSLKECSCKPFKIRYSGKTTFCYSIIDVNRDYSKCGLNYFIRDLMVVGIGDRSFDLSPEMQLTDFKDFEITYKSKTIYKLSDNIWSDLYECKSKILKLQEEQLMFAKSIINANR